MMTMFIGNMVIVSRFCYIKDKYLRLRYVIKIRIIIENISGRD